MTGVARRRREAKLAVRRPRGQGFVAIGAGRCGVAPGKRKRTRGVPRGRKCGRLEARRGVAKVALVAIPVRKRALVRIRVTGRTRRLPSMVNGGASRGLMTLGAGNGSVLSFQGKGGAAVRLHVKPGRLEPVDHMASRTVRSGGARRELAAMRVLMTVGAALVRHGAVKVSALVAGGAGNRGVFPAERETGARMAETGIGAVGLPSRRGMAGLTRAAETCFVKRAPVWIGVTGLTAVKRQSRELLGSVRPQMAFLAWH